MNPTTASWLSPGVEPFLRGFGWVTRWQPEIHVRSRGQRVSVSSVSLMDVDTSTEQTPRESAGSCKIPPPRPSVNAEGNVLGVSLWRGTQQLPLGSASPTRCICQRQLLLSYSRSLFGTRSESASCVFFVPPRVPSTYLHLAARQDISFGSVSLPFPFVPC